MKMKIQTNLPLPIFDNTINTMQVNQSIADFWDATSYGWKKIWGPHIHHGFYEHPTSSQKIPKRVGINYKQPLLPQELLIDKLFTMLNLQMPLPMSPLYILDVGCGMGGTSYYLAEKYRVRILGITLSQKQIDLAKQRFHPQVSFQQEDAHDLSHLAENSFDIVWSLESCEQFYDKALFLEQAYRVLKPGGRLMLATWCSNQEEYENRAAAEYQQLCQAFLLPYMPTMKYYSMLLEKHFTLIKTENWIAQVKQSWDLGIKATQGYALLKVLWLGRMRGLKFVRQLRLMKKWIDHNRLAYGVFIAEKHQ